MTAIKNYLTFLFVALFLLISGGLSYSFAQDSSPSPTPTPTGSLTPTPTGTQKLSDLQSEIEKLQQKVTELQSTGKTLSSQITVMDNQITLTEYRINATEQEIAEVTGDIDAAENRINNLEGSLEDITKVMLNRIVATYQIGTIEPIQMLLSSDTVTSFLSRANYLRIAQAHDKKLIYNTVQARNDYENQREIFEGKKQKVLSLQTQLEGYTKQLDEDKNAKQALLKVTQNDEKKYEELLSRARSEYMSIQGIVAGNGAETSAGFVSEGSRIASIIPGASCNSSGGHLHFIVSRNGTTENPFSYLGGIELNNNSGSSPGSSDGDPAGMSGSWTWPLSGPISMAQGYGATWAVRNTWVGRVYNFHNGIDVTGSSYTVKAVKSGTLFRGSYGGSGGCRLPYVRVHHEDGLDTFYLHVNY